MRRCFSGDPASPVTDGPRSLTTGAAVIVPSGDLDSRRIARINRDYNRGRRGPGPRVDPHGTATCSTRKDRDYCTLLPLPRAARSGPSLPGPGDPPSSWPTGEPVTVDLGGRAQPDARRTRAAADHPPGNRIRAVGHDSVLTRSYTRCWPCAPCGTPSPRLRAIAKPARMYCIQGQMVTLCGRQRRRSPDIGPCPSSVAPSGTRVPGTRFESRSPARPVAWLPVRDRCARGPRALRKSTGPSLSAACWGSRNQYPFCGRDPRTHRFRTARSPTTA